MPDEAKRDDRGIWLPAPTASPMIFALGITLLFGGLVTHPIVSGVGGALFLAGALGWWRVVLPVQQEERVPLQPRSERAHVVSRRRFLLGAVLAKRPTSSQAFAANTSSITCPWVL